MQLRLFLDWGIRFEKPYEVPEKVQRPVAYATKQALELAIQSRQIKPQKQDTPDEQEEAPAPEDNVEVEMGGADADSFRKLLLCYLLLSAYRTDACANMLVVNHSTALPDSDTCIVSTIRLCYNNPKIQMY